MGKPPRASDGREVIVIYRSAKYAASSRARSAMHFDLPAVFASRRAAQAKQKSASGASCPKKSITSALSALLPWTSLQCCQKLIDRDVNLNDYKLFAGRRPKGN